MSFCRRTVYLCGLFVPALVAAQLPFSTQDARPRAHGFLSVDVGVGYRSDARDFGVPNRDRQLDVGKARLTVGVGEWVEVQLTGTTYSVAESSSAIDSSVRRSDFGDWRLGTKIRFVTEKGRRPAMALLWEVKLPNASLAQGLGTDETDFFAQYLLSRSVGEKDRLTINAGLGLLGIPSQEGGQDDVSLLKLAWRRTWSPAAHGESSSQLWTGLEWTFQDGFEEVDSPVVARALIGQDRGVWSVYAGIGLGLNDEADTVAIEIGARRRLSFRRP